MVYFLPRRGGRILLRCSHFLLPSAGTGTGYRELSVKWIIVGLGIVAGVGALVVYLRAPVGLFIAISLGNQSTNHWAQGDYDAAERVARRALTIGKWAAGQTISTLRSFASICRGCTMHKAATKRPRYLWSGHWRTWNRLRAVSIPMSPLSWTI